MDLLFQKVFLLYDFMWLHLLKQNLKTSLVESIVVLNQI